MKKENEKSPNLLMTLLCSKFEPRDAELSKFQAVPSSHSSEIDRLIKKIDDELKKLRE